MGASDTKAASAKEQKFPNRLVMARGDIKHSFLGELTLRELSKERNDTIESKVVSLGIQRKCGRGDHLSGIVQIK